MGAPSPLGAPSPWVPPCLWVSRCPGCPIFPCPCSHPLCPAGARGCGRVGDPLLAAVRSQADPLRPCPWSSWCQPGDLPQERARPSQRGGRAHFTWWARCNRPVLQQRGGDAGHRVLAERVLRNPAGAAVQGQPPVLQQPQPQALPEPGRALMGPAASVALGDGAVPTGAAFWVASATPELPGLAQPQLSLPPKQPQPHAPGIVA